MPLVGTAGHVDHGKSTLVRRLTGRDPDRWAEEKRRGLTIDLGFAWSTLPSGTVVSFVDVPGHERFMKNMLAGVDGFETALLVVAADEGWSPQTTEHVAALHALGVERAVVAVTKIDAADPDLVDLVALETEERLAATSLAGAPIVAVSAISGVGIDELEAALDSALSTVPDRSGLPVRLAIDRAFTVPGAGTVVTGSLGSGVVATGDELELMPAGRVVTVRGLHRHDEPVEQAAAGSRVAVNLAGIDRDDLARGMVLAEPGTTTATDRILLELRAVPDQPSPDERGAFHLHLGTGVWPVVLRPVDHRAALAVAEEPMPTAAGDRVVLREVGRRTVVGGGRVADPDPPQRRRDALALLDRLVPVAATPDGRASSLLAVHRSAAVADLRRWSGGGGVTGATVVGAIAFASGVLEELAARAGPLVDRAHADHPLRPGLRRAELASALGVTPEVLDQVVAGGGLQERGAWVARPGHRPRLDDVQLDAWSAVRRELAEAGTSPPRADELGLDEEVLHFLYRAEELVPVGAFAFLPDTIDQVVATVDALGDGWTVSAFREALGTSRRHAVPLAEWLDARAITRRDGDRRSRRRPGTG